MNNVETISLVANIATAAGVLATAAQIRAAKAQDTCAFEDSFSKEYRSIANKIPTRALLGSALSEHEKSAHFDEFFRYFDLSNEQIFLRQQRRIRKKTWIFWCDGMKSHFRKPAFRWAWDEIENTKTTECSEYCASPDKTDTRWAC